MDRQLQWCLSSCVPASAAWMASQNGDPVAASITTAHKRAWPNGVRGGGISKS